MASHDHDADQTAEHASESSAGSAFDARAANQEGSDAQQQAGTPLQPPPTEVLSGSATAEAADHSAAASVLGYQYQTRWGLLELLRHRTSRPDLSLSLEMFDDVAWDQEGTPAELKQLKLHVTRTGQLGDASVDLWRTLKVWIDGARPADPYGPVLSIVTNAIAAEGSAAALLRASVYRDPAAALALLENAARDAKSQTTVKWRQAFLKLDPSARQSFVSRIYVADRSPDLEEIDTEVNDILWSGIPLVGADTYVDLIWSWWGKVSLDLLKGRRLGITVHEVRVELDRIRDLFTEDNLPTLVELQDVDEGQALLDHGTRTFVKQMRWVGVGQVNLTKAVIDYYRAYTQTTAWIDRNIVGLAELDRFVENLKDEWSRAFEDMLDDLPATAAEDEKRAAGKKLFRQLRDSTLTIRSRYTDPFFARGKRHELADRGDLGWHPDFETHLAQLLLGDTSAPAGAPATV